MSQRTQVFRRLVLLLYGALAVFMWVGFLTDESRTPWLFGYSPSYVLLLVLLPIVLIVPVVIAWLIGRHGIRTVGFAGLPILVIVALTYVVASSVYYARQEHRFDPFLQVAPPTRSDVPASRDPAELRIVTLGGSTTKADWLPVEERYPGRLGALLAEAHPTLTPRVFNAGQEWWTTKHSLIHYVTHVRAWKPDLVLAMHAVNDLYRSFAPEAFALGDYNAGWSHFCGPAINGARPPSFVRYLAGNIPRLTFLHWYRDWRVREVDYPVARYRSLPQFEENIRALVHYVRADGGRVILLTQPSLYKDNPSLEERRAIRFGEEFCSTRTGWWTAEYPTIPSLGRAMQAFNDVIRRVGAELDVLVIDLDAGIPKTLDMLLDDVHTNSRGAAAVAQQIFEAIEEHGALAAP